MKITKIETYPLVWPKFENKLWSGGAVISSVACVVVKIHTDEGIVGLGEGHSGMLIGIAGDFTERMIKAAAIIDQGLKDLLIGEDPLNNERLWEKMFSFTYRQAWSLRGWPQPEIMTAIGTLDVALWDIKGKAARMPIWKLLGGYRNRVPCYVTGGYYTQGKTNADLAKECESYLKIGYNAIKLKIGGLEVEEDLARVKVARDTIGPDIKLMVDASESWDVPTAIRAARALEEFDLYWLEEPVRWYDHVGAMAEVVASTKIPIASGANLFSRWAARDLIERAGVRIVQFNCTKAAGPTEWLKIAGLASCHYAQMAPHHEPQIHGHLVAAVPNGLILESFPDPARDPVWAELYSVRPEIKNSEIVFTDDLPGWGIDYDEKVIQKRAVKI